jgi:hypothetical protein
MPPTRDSVGNSAPFRDLAYTLRRGRADAPEPHRAMFDSEVLDECSNSDGRSQRARFGRLQQRSRKFDGQPH